VLMEVVTVPRFNVHLNNDQILSRKYAAFQMERAQDTR
jgi:hypothetical protein